jgi:hypothetical protein
MSGGQRQLLALLYGSSLLRGAKSEANCRCFSEKSLENQFHTRWSERIAPDASA